MLRYTSAQYPQHFPRQNAEVAWFLDVNEAFVSKYTFERIEATPHEDRASEPDVPGPLGSGPNHEARLVRVDDLGWLVHERQAAVGHSELPPPLYPHRPRGGHAVQRQDLAKKP